MADKKGLFQAWLSPGARIPLALEAFTVWFTAGPTTYDFDILLTDTPFVSVETAAELEAWLDDVGWRLQPPVRVSSEQLRESGMLEGRRRWLDRPSTLFDLLVRADARDGTGRAARYYDVGVRLAHAAPMIAGGMPLARVAEELGYASQSAFSQMFRKTFGTTPTAFFSER